MSVKDAVVRQNLIVDPSGGNPYEDGKLSVSTYPGDSHALDSFGRQRVAAPFGIFDNKQIHASSGTQFEEITAGAGTVTFQYDRSSSALAVGTASGDRALRQSTRYLAYVPGKSHKIDVTGVLAPLIANRDQFIGYGDDLNGIFFKAEGVDFGLLLRSSVTGSVVDNFVDQTDWNIDKLDGNGPSGITLDLTKTHITGIDFQWLGVGRIRYSMNIGGVPISPHSNS
jgi:hypothetical protein